MRTLASILGLAAFWWLLSGQTTGFLLGCGVVSIALAQGVALRMGLVDDEGVPVQALLRLPAYAPWLLWQVVLSNWDVVRRVWSPSLPIAPRMVRIPCLLRTGFGRATYANSITLTPGTVTVDTGEREFLVHALHAEAAAGLETGEMHRRVARLEGQG